MEKTLINLNITSKQDLDEIIGQYENGGRALSAIDDYRNVLRNAYKHGYEEYLAEVRRLMQEDQKLMGQEEDPVEVSDKILEDIASASMEYFRTKFFEAIQENAVKDHY